LGMRRKRGFSFIPVGSLPKQSFLPGQVVLRILSSWPPPRSSPNPTSRLRCLECLDRSLPWYLELFSRSQREPGCILDCWRFDQGNRIVSVDLG
jgi:hypothetical protein